MLEFTAARVRMHKQVVDKNAALVLVAQALADDGLADSTYLEGLLAREQQCPTYLGQGVAIPHGTPESRGAVRQTGVSLLHFADGVAWDGEQRIYLAVGIAAQSDEHLGILQALARALARDDLEDRLRGAQQPADVLACLSGPDDALRLDPSLVALKAEVLDIEDLANVAAQRLKVAGCVSPGFVGHLLGRTPLPLANGLWWVHSDAAVRQAALAFVTPRVDLSDSEGLPVRGLFCLASAGQSHRRAVARLCDLLLAGDLSCLLEESDPQRVAQALGAPEMPTWQQAAVRLPNPLGLHARPAKALVDVAKGFEGDIKVCVAQAGAEPVSAKSLSRLLALGARGGQSLVFHAPPEVAQQALPALVQAVESGLGDVLESLPSKSIRSPHRDVNDLAASPSAVRPAADTPSVGVNVAPDVAVFETLQSGLRYRAVPAAPGFASGPVHVALPPVLAYPAQGASPEVEIRHLDEATAVVRDALCAWLTSCTSKDMRGIFSAHVGLLDDLDLRARALSHINDGASAPAAWAHAVADAAAMQAALADHLLAERAADIRDVGQRVLLQLCGVTLAEPPVDPYILVMPEISPSAVAQLDPLRVAGILTAHGGATSHGAIVARSLGIAAIVGAGKAVLALPCGTPVLLDGERGDYWISPQAVTVVEAQIACEARMRRQTRDHAQRFTPAVTQDGYTVKVYANIDKVGSVADAIEVGAEGVGLLRTELLFMAAGSAPGFDEQVTSYRSVFDALEGRPLVVRTLDVGGDKPLSYLPMPSEENPFLGVRGIRLSLQHPEMLRTQLQALLVASGGQPVRIMFPMVTDLAEWRWARAMVDDVIAAGPPEIARDRLNLQLGIMIEVPSAALLAERFAPEVDFFSLGTNDLTQYVLAIDRGHAALSAQADGLHPAVLRLIATTVQAAHAHKKWVGVCGELARDPLAALLLVGLGVDELSLSASGIARIKADIRSSEWTALQALGQRALQAESPHAVRKLVQAESD
jgi:phosphocarrier protein FPr